MCKYLYSWTYVKFTTTYILEGFLEMPVIIQVKTNYYQVQLSRFRKGAKRLLVLKLTI
jgi:hypothetical protein